MTKANHPRRWRFGAMWMLAFALILSGCASKPTPTSAPPASAGDWTRIDAAQLAAMLEKKDFTLVNVHIPYMGEIAQTDLLIPYNEIGGRLGELPGKDARLVLYCSTGPMSTSAARTLVALGYTQVYELEGGMSAWQAAGKQLVRR